MEPFFQGFLCGLGTGAFGLVLFVIVLGWFGAPDRGPVVGRRPGEREYDDDEIDAVARQLDKPDRPPQRERTQWD